jgi:hypothetical protein
MAVFLLKAEHGSATRRRAAPASSATSPCPSRLRRLDRAARAEQITGGCGGGNYCPLDNNTRGQMAVFITKTFNLQ